MSNVILTTPRTLISEISTNDAPFLLELFNSPGWIEYIGDRNLNTLSEMETYVNDFFVSGYKQNGFGYYLISSLNRENIGIAGFLKKPYLDNEDYGFAIMPSFHQSGFGYEVGQALIKYGLEEFDFRVLDAVTKQSNIASQKLLEKLGFESIGEIKLPDKTEKDSLYRWHED